MSEQRDELSELLDDFTAAWYGEWTLDAQRGLATKLRDALDKWLEQPPDPEDT